MIFIACIVIALVVAVMAFLNHRAHYWSDPSPFFYTLMALVIGTIVGMGASIIVYSVTVEVEPRRFNIESLGDGAGAEGSFFLGGGTVDTEAVFFYYAPRASGGYGLFHVDADETTIFEDQTNSGYLIKYCEDTRSASEWVNLPFIDIEKPLSVDDPERYDCSYSERYEFHIPENSIDRRFNLDAS